jgi:hypothetical protein
MKHTRTIAVAALAVAALAGCGSTAATTAAHQAARPSVTTAPARPAAASRVPVLTPGHSATFTIRPFAGGTATSVTWTMGRRVAKAADADKPGYESAGFQVTIRNNGPAPTEGSPDYGSSLTWTGTDGRSDDTLAQQAAAATASQFGLTGTDITLQGSLPPGGYVSGYLIWEIPVAPGYVTLLSGSADGNSTYPVLRIDY